MAPTFALHLGAHKTATTFIQRNLEDRRRELLRQGVRYFGTSELRDVEGIVLPTPRDVREGLAEPLQRRTATTLRQLVDDAIPDHARRVLLSEENFLGSSRLNIRRGKLYPAMEDRLRCLPESWNSDRLEIFLSIRDYASFFASCHSTIALQGDWMEFGAEKQAAIAELPRRWTDVVREIRAVFPRAEMVIWRYEDLATLGQHVMNDMVGFDFPMDFSHKGTMASLTAQGMDRLRIAWEENDGEPLDTETVRDIRKATQDGDRYDPWSPDIKAVLSDAYAKDWAQIQAMMQS